LNKLYTSRGHIAVLAIALLLLGGCKTTKTGADSSAQPTTDAAGNPVPYDPKIWDKGPQEALGAYLAELDKSMRAWTNLTLSARTRGDKSKASMLQKDLMRRVDLRRTDLIDALETGPPRNRAIAAGALGFSTSDDVQGPLLVALGDKHNEVVQNAALSLALREQADTPLTPILEVMQNNISGQARANAAYAVRTILEAGAAPGEDVIKAGRNGLLDIEPFAQAQSVLILAIALDGPSVPHMAELLSSDSPLVVRASIQALLAMGKEDSKLLGPTARGLVAGLRIANSVHRPEIYRALTSLSGHSYGQEERLWVEWAQRLP
jgi:hypothetical protein